MINTYVSLLNQKPKMKIILPLVILFLIGGLNLSWIIDVYSTYNVKAISEGKYLLLSIPINNSDILKSGDYLKINNKNYYYNVISISPLQNDGEVNYQNYEIEIDDTFQLNEIKDITIFYQKERIITKIKKMFL